MPGCYPRWYRTAVHDLTQPSLRHRFMTTAAVPPTKSRLIVKRKGRAITSTIPRPTVIVDTREQCPFSFENFGNWIGAVRRGTVAVGDYTIEGMESLLAIERKSFPDLLMTLIHARDRFIRECEKLQHYRWKAILIEASYEDVKSPYAGTFSDAHPNGVAGTLDAIEARYGIPIIYTSQHKCLAEEKTASFLSKHFTYWYLEENGLGRVLQEGDL